MATETIDREAVTVATLAQYFDESADRWERRLSDDAGKSAARVAEDEAHASAFRYAAKVTRRATENDAAGGTWTLDHGLLSRDGRPLLTLVRAHWGDGAPKAAELEALSQRIVDLLNADRKGA